MASSGEASTDRRPGPPSRSLDRADRPQQDERPVPRTGIELNVAADVVPPEQLAERGGQLFEAAARIRDTERAQAARIRGGESLRAQLDHPRFLAERERRPEWTFRDHLRTIGGAIEE